jgi:hypothetical protein
MLCRLCLQDKKLVEAHIIPRCFLAHLSENEGQMTRLSVEPGSYLQRSQTGEYDSEILCGLCDGSLGPWEEYSADLLYEVARPYAEDHVADEVFSVPQYDYAQLKLCLPLRHFGSPSD